MTNIIGAMRQTIHANEMDVDDRYGITNGMETYSGYWPWGGIFTWEFMKASAESNYAPSTVNAGMAGIGSCSYGQYRISGGIGKYQAYLDTHKGIISHPISTNVSIISCTFHGFSAWQNDSPAAGTNIYDSSGTSYNKRGAWTNTDETIIGGVFIYGLQTETNFYVLGSNVAALCGTTNMPPWCNEPYKTEYNRQIRGYDLSWNAKPVGILIDWDYKYK